VTQHSSLTPERWRTFDLDQQILMIANEMNRTGRFVERAEVEPVRRGYVRVLRLTDLTVACHRRTALWRELLRWRDLVAEMYNSRPIDPPGYRAALRALLLLSPVASKQIPLLLPRW